MSDTTDVGIPEQACPGRLFDLGLGGTGAFEIQRPAGIAPADGLQTPYRVSRPFVITPMW